MERSGQISATEDSRVAAWDRVHPLLGWPERLAYLLCLRPLAAHWRPVVIRRQKAADIEGIRGVIAADQTIAETLLEVALVDH